MRESVIFSTGLTSRNETHDRETVVTVDHDTVIAWFTVTQVVYVAVGRVELVAALCT